MLFECSCVALLTCVFALVVIYGNRLYWWRSWLICAAGGFAFVILLAAISTSNGFVSGFIMAGLVALLKWIGAGSFESEL